ncbi:hypothetical protein G6F37_012256 [Rhizopus arrhizus]|nr:hypothetical protein G6F38_012296 [Rhizopus arrhizus]KAG1144710.1 hypothetical protein G6F37_012256 [Rhizopus arrhizus]
MSVLFVNVLSVPTTHLAHSNPSFHPFDTIAIDTFGPLPPSLSGNRYIIVVQYLFSRYVCLFAVPSNTDQQVIQCLLKIIGEHGIFRALLSDNGPPYSGVLIKALADHLRIKQKFAPAYHPQSNGLVERFMETLKNMICSYLDLDNHQNTWDNHLSELQLAYNSTPNQVTKHSPFSLVHGREARILATTDFGVKTIPVEECRIQSQDFLVRALNLVKMENIQSQAANALRYNAQREAPIFSVDDLVLVDCPVLSNAFLGRARKLVKKYRGPFRISEVISNDRYNVEENLSHALEAVTARLSALEQLKLELETLRDENARLAETNLSQANEIASLHAQLAAQSAGVPTSTPNSTTTLSSAAPANGAKESVPSPSLGTACCRTASDHNGR